MHGYFLTFQTECTLISIRSHIKCKFPNKPLLQDARDEYLSATDSQAGDSSSDILRKLQSVEHHLKIIRRVGNKTSSVYAWDLRYQCVGGACYIPCYKGGGVLYAVL